MRKPANSPQEATATVEPVPDDGPPEEVWDAWFSRNRPDPRVVADMILRLHEAGRHEHVIAAIEAALIHDQSQPWMYEVLGLSMQIAGRPRDEVERVMFSAVDFAGADFESMLYSAAYLTRFGLARPALHLYRQASRLQETRPEPYVMGLRLAQELSDHDAVGWAARGILSYAWTPGHETLHRDAEDAVLDAEQALRTAGDDAAADELAKTLAEAKQRDLVLRLTWSGDGDLDLIVEEPAGTECSYSTPQSPGGGVLVHDGYGPDPANCHEDYVCAQGMQGSYRVRVRHAWGTIVGKRAQLTVTRYAGTERETSYTVTLSLEGDDTVLRVPLPDGRRRNLLSPQEPQPADAAQAGNPRKSLLAILDGFDPNARRAARDFQRSRQRAAGSDVGYQPVVSVLSEGAALSTMAVVSGDRRYVRLSIVPTFSNITDVFTFSFINSGTP